MSPGLKQARRWARPLGIVWLALLGSFWSLVSAVATDVTGAAVSSKSPSEVLASQVRVKKIPCSEELALELVETREQRPRPVPIKLELPALAKSAVGDRQLGSKALGHQVIRFSEVPSLVRFVFCLVRWGALASCREVS